MNRYEYEVLTFVEKNGERAYPMRFISDNIAVSGNTISSCLNSMVDCGWIIRNGDVLSISDIGRDALEPYRVKKAVIMAAGFGSRMLPATADRPKPMVTVNGERIIDTLLNALLKVDITDVTIIRGYKKECFNQLLVKYPYLKFVDNDLFNVENNISSAIKAIDEIDNCYLCEADLFVSNPDIITKYQYTSNILGSYSLETDDWSFRLKDGYISDYKKGNTYCFNYYGISYWTAMDSAQLRKDWCDVYNTNKNVFWEEVPLILKKDNYRVEIRQCDKSDIIEIDNYYELAQLDPSYK